MADPGSDETSPTQASPDQGTSGRLRKAGTILLGLLFLPLIGLYAAVRRAPLVVAALLLALAAAYAVSFLAPGYQRDVSASMALGAEGDRATALAWVDGQNGALQVGTQRGAFHLVARNGSVTRTSPAHDQGPIVTILVGPPQASDTLHYAWLANNDRSTFQSDGDGGVGIPMSAPLSFLINRTVTIVTEDGSASETPAKPSNGKPLSGKPSKGKAPSKSGKPSGAEQSQQSRLDLSSPLGRFPAALPGGRPDAGSGSGAAGTRVSAIAVLRRADGTERVVAGYDNGDVRTTNAAGDLGYPAVVGAAPPPSTSPIVAIVSGLYGSQQVFVHADAEGSVTASLVPSDAASPPSFSSYPLRQSEPQQSEPRKTALPAKDGLALSRNAEVLMVHGEDGSIRIARSPFLQNTRYARLNLYDLGDLKGTSAAALSPRGDLFAVAGNDGAIRIVVLPDDEQAPPSTARILRVTGHANVITHLAISHDGRYLASAGIDGRVLITDLDSLLWLSRLPLFDLPTGPAIATMTPAPIMAASAGVTASTPNSGDYGVLFGSDMTLESARDEVARAKDKGVANVAVYKRNASYASVAIFSDRNTRSAGLTILRNLSQWSAGARPITMSYWCRQPRQAEGYIDCQNTADDKTGARAE